MIFIMKSTNGNTNKDLSEYSFCEVVNKLYLAGLGAIAIKHDEMEAYIDKLEERGKLAKINQENIVNKSKQRFYVFRDQRKYHLQKRTQKIIKGLNIPSKSDIEKVNSRIFNLEIKINELVRRKDV